MTGINISNSSLDYGGLLREFKGCSMTLDMNPNLTAHGSKVESKYEHCTGSTKPIYFTCGSCAGFYLFCRSYKNSITRLVQLSYIGSTKESTSSERNTNVGVSFPVEVPPLQQVEVTLSHQVSDMSKVDSKHVAVAVGNTLKLWKRKKDRFGFVDCKSIQIVEENTPIHLVVPSIKYSSRTPLGKFSKKADCEWNNTSESWGNCLIGSREGLSCIQIDSVPGFKIAHFKENEIVTSMKWNRSNPSTRTSSSSSDKLFSATWDEGALKFYDLRTTTTKPISSQYVQKGLFDHIYIDDDVNHTIACGGLGGIIHLFDDRKLCKPLFLQIDPFNQDIYEFSSSAYDVIGHAEDTEVGSSDGHDNQFQTSSSIPINLSTINQNGLLCFGLSNFTVWNYDRRSNGLIFRDMKQLFQPFANTSRYSHIHGLFTASNSCRVASFNNEGAFEEWHIKPFSYFDLSSQTLASRTANKIQASPLLELMQQTDGARIPPGRVPLFGGKVHLQQLSPSTKRKHKDSIPISKQKKPAMLTKPSTSTQASPLSRAIIVHQSSGAHHNEWDWDIDFHRDWSKSSNPNSRNQSPQHQGIEDQYQPSKLNFGSGSAHDLTFIERPRAVVPHIPVIEVKPSSGETISAKDISEKADEIFLTSSVICGPPLASKHPNSPSLNSGSVDNPDTETSTPQKGVTQGERNLHDIEVLIQLWNEK